MHDELSMRDDAALLALWVNERRHEAFARLVATYQRMVLGAALRRTRDTETARDVAQQVFATLAARAHWLLGRPSIAGWLYHAASHVAARAARAEGRRRAALERFEREPAGANASGVPWDLVEEALAALSTGDREAIVLHYFQDLSYPEMAAAIGIAEPAARKRVSRALTNLEDRLARRGVRGAAAAILAGAVAQQGAVTVQAGLAATAAGSAAATPWALTFFAMSQNTLVKIAAGLATALVLPLAFQSQSNASVRANLASRRAVPKPPAANIGSDEQRQKLASLNADLAAKRHAADAAERRAVELAEMKRKVETEVVYSYGTLDGMARRIVEFMRLTEVLEQAQKRPKPDPNTDEGRKALAKLEADGKRVAEALPQFLGVVRGIPQLERSPEKAGRFYARFYAAMTDLDEARLPEIERRATDWVRELQDSDLAFPQRPQGDARRSGMLAARKRWRISWKSSNARSPVRSRAASIPGVGSNTTTANPVFLTCSWARRLGNESDHGAVHHAGFHGGGAADTQRGRNRISGPSPQRTPHPRDGTRSAPSKSCAPRRSRDGAGNREGFLRTRARD